MISGLAVVMNPLWHPRRMLKGNLHHERKLVSSIQGMPDYVDLT